MTDFRFPEKVSDSVEFGCGFRIRHIPTYIYWFYWICWLELKCQFYIRLVYQLNNHRSQLTEKSEGTWRFMPTKTCKRQLFIKSATGKLCNRYVNEFMHNTSSNDNKPSPKKLLLSKFSYLPGETKLDKEIANGDPLNDDLPAGWTAGIGTTGITSPLPVLRNPRDRVADTVVTQATVGLIRCTMRAFNKLSYHNVQQK